MRSWPRTLAVGAGAGLVVGLVVGGTLGRLFMRIVFLADEEHEGFETAMGAILGDFTSGGTVFIYLFGAFAGLVLGLAYCIGRTLLANGTRRRVVVFTVGTTAFLLGQIVRDNRADFGLVPVSLSLALIVVSVAITAAPVPILVERFAPDRPRTPGPVARAVVALGMTAFLVFAVSGVVIAYSEPPF